MAQNWHNFIFGAFDRWGTVTVDTLPGALRRVAGAPGRGWWPRWRYLCSRSDGEKALAAPVPADVPAGESAGDSG